MNRFFWGYAAGAVLALALVGATNFVVDPLQYFRVYQLGRPFFFKDQRYQAPGLARNYPYDTVIVGTSMTENFRPSQIKAVSGWNAVKLSISGGYAFEQRKILDVALATGRVKRVIWGVEWDSFARPATERADLGGLPLYFYEDRPAELVYRYLLNISTLGRSLHALHIGSFTVEHDLDQLNNWSSLFKLGCPQVGEAYHSQGDLRRFRAAEDEGRIVLSNEKMVESLQTQLWDEVARHPDVEFYIFTPPYSIWFLRWLDQYDQKALNSFFFFRQELSAHVGQYPNVHFYDFQSDSSVIGNAALYRDLTHYSQDISDELIASMAKDVAQAQLSNEQMAGLMKGPETCLASAVEGQQQK